VPVLPPGFSPRIVPVCTPPSPLAVDTSLVLSLLFSPVPGCPLSLLLSPMLGWLLSRRALSGCAGALPRAVVGWLLSLREVTCPGVRGDFVPLPSSSLLVRPTFLPSCPPLIPSILGTADLPPLPLALTQHFRRYTHNDQQPTTSHSRRSANDTTLRPYRQGTVSPTTFHSANPPPSLPRPRVSSRLPIGCGRGLLCALYTR
jgi:hypothetical protein